jgi:hypothetical protein
LPVVVRLGAKLVQPRGPGGGHGRLRR